MAVEVAEIIFREILGMSSYPGSPFTGNPFQDILLFFFVPTVVLIIFVYIASAIPVPPQNHRLRLLMALSIYAFIIASRYYEGFAFFVTQFYLVFIIFIAALYFIARHFGGGGGHMRYEGGGGRLQYGDYDDTRTRRKNVISPRERTELNAQLRVIERRIANAQRELGRATRGSHEAAEWARKISALEEQAAAIREELRYKW